MGTLVIVNVMVLFVEVEDTVPDLVVAQNGEPQYRPQNVIIRIMGTPKKVPLILRNPHIDLNMMLKF